MLHSVKGLRTLLCSQCLLALVLPGGIFAQKIDVSWDVLPPMIVRDAFGRHVSSKYFAVSVSIRNTTETTLVVKSFDLITTDDQRLLSVDFNTVRASLVKGQLTGRRNTGVRALKGAGATAAALNGFFKNVASAATYGRIVSVFSGPLITAIEAVVPDTTVQYLDAWDKSEVFKQGFVVEPGKPANGVIFIPIQSLYPDYIKPDRKSSSRFKPTEVKAKIAEVLPQGFAIPTQKVVGITPDSLRMVP